MSPPLYQSIFPSLYLSHPFPFQSFSPLPFHFDPPLTHLFSSSQTINLFYLQFFYIFSPFPLFPSIHLFFLHQPNQGKAVSKSVSMNSGTCKGMMLGLKTLSHSDSYTWAMENRRPSTARSQHKDSSVSSLDSQELSLSDFYPENCIHVASQVCKTFIINKGSLKRVLVTGSNLFLKHSAPETTKSYFSLQL